MDYKVLDSVWYTPPLVNVLVEVLFDSNDLCIGVVAIESDVPDKDGTIHWKAYIGYGMYGDQEKDEQSIAANGAKISQDVACAHFPQFPIEGFVL